MNTIRTTVMAWPRWNFNRIKKFTQQRVVRCNDMYDIHVQIFSGVPPIRLNGLIKLETFRFQNISVESVPNFRGAVLKTTKTRVGDVC